ncbi:MAG: UDP-N-acetylmuramoyl-L-alanine--D-glutamate ligase [Endomicrobium sp.]|jgi:UDP-N-acetylmuramoylalanine--D-glutamate ligase|nr:UDP-N-acetylmuramoyl-L-alanine--D-glutamate ligase [Endomicrobium sp.]
MTKKVSILGIGKSGIAAAKLAAKVGYDVFISDIDKRKANVFISGNIKTEVGIHSKKILESDFIIKSPGIEKNIPILQEAIKRNIPVISEIEFSILIMNKQFKHNKIIAITGTNGKSTTTELIYKIIKEHYKNTIIAGNFGFPLSKKVSKITKDTIIVLEMSSYQLEDSPNFKPDIGILLNITPDHIIHHKTMELYIKAKKNIFINQNNNDFAIINYDSFICKTIAKDINSKIFFFSRSKTINNGVYYDNGNILINIDSKCVILKPKINIIGKHNIENILAAVLATYIIGIKIKIIEKVISKYKGIQHRIEFVKNINGVSYYNDSKSTNIASTKTAIDAFNNNIILIMGGQDKGISYITLRKIIKKKVKHVFLIGEATNKIKKDLKNLPITNSGNLKNALRSIINIAIKGDIVLFSPACASFDQFKNFEERGKLFKKIINDFYEKYCKKKNN